MSRHKYQILGGLVVSILLLIAILFVQESPSAPQSLVSVPLIQDRTNADVLESDCQFICPIDGQYWLQLRYSQTLRQIDAKGTHRKLGQSVMSAFHVSPVLEMTDLDSKTVVLTQEDVKWTPVETSTKKSRVSGDRVSLELRKGVKYNLVLKVPDPDPQWLSLNPTLTIDPSDAIRNAEAFSVLKARRTKR